MTRRGDRNKAHLCSNFLHRDHRKAGRTTTDAVYPFARDHLQLAEQITQEGLAPHKVREFWYWGADEPNVIVDVTDSIERQIAALVRHESQMPGLQRGGRRDDRRAAQEGRGRPRGGLRLSLRRGVPAPRRAAVTP